MTLIILLVVVALVVLWALGAYNGFVKLKNMVEEAWSGISVQLKRRHDLVPNLVATTKGMAGHEKELMTAVTNARAARTVGEAVKAEAQVSRLLGSFVATAEAYPEIKADASFNKVMSELSSLENELQMARRYYNGAAREYNTAIQTMPKGLIARLFNFKEKEYFELDSAEEAAVPTVDFSA